MFSKQQEKYLIRRLGRNEVVLFLGAGFATNATNLLGETLPTGGMLAGKIWKFLNIDGDFDNTPLQQLYELFLKSPIKKVDKVNFLSEIFSVKEFKQEYDSLTIPYWYKIYTTNIDNLVDLVYKKQGMTKLDILKYPTDDYKERDQTLLKTQIIYLNGKLPCELEQIIFSRKQYAKSTLVHQPLYDQFVHDYSTLPTIFIGTSIDEPIFEQYIEARQARKSNISEQRPLSFLIDPFIPPVRAQLLRESYNIEPIKATVDEFLFWLNTIQADIPDRIGTLKVTLPSLPDLYELPRYNRKSIDSVNDFALSFKRVTTSYYNIKNSKSFLLGTTPTWADIHNNLDAPRFITNDINEHVESIFEVEKQLKIIALLGSAGSGKSTVLKRLGLRLAQNGRSVYYSYSEYIPKIDSIIETLNLINEKVILIFDNAELIINFLPKIAEKLNSVTYPPIIILATRTNVFDKISSRIDPIVNLKEFKMPLLNREEIVEIISILDTNNLLGYLKGKNDLQRIQEFEYRAKKQILVAMREATKGLDFDEIIRSEFNDIEPADAKILCLCVALTTDAGFTVSRQDFVGFSNCEPSIALHYLERILCDVILKVGPKEDRLLFRHRAIAEFIIDNCADSHLLKIAYVNLLTVLASEINQNEFNSRKFSLYREVINHYVIYKRFKKNINLAREVYDTIMPYFNDDFQFWLQYGSLEVEGFGGNLELAENYLTQSASLKPKNFYVKNALGNLYYKKSLKSKTLSEAIIYKEEADKILKELFMEKGIEDAHTYHIYCSGYYNFIKKWIDGNADKKPRLFELLNIIKQGVSLHPVNKRLEHIHSVINKAYLLTGVNENVDHPVIFSDFE